MYIPARKLQYLLQSTPSFLLRKISCGHTIVKDVSSEKSDGLSFIVKSKVRMSDDLFIFDIEVDSDVMMKTIPFDKCGRQRFYSTQPTASFLVLFTFRNLRDLLT